VESPVTAIALIALSPVTALVAINQLALWLRHRGERLHLWWAIWCTLGFCYLISRALQVRATEHGEVLFAMDLQYALGYGMMVSIFLVVHDQVRRPPGRRMLLALAITAPLIGAAMFIDGVVTSGDHYIRTDMLGQQALEVGPGRLVIAYTVIMCGYTTACLVAIIRHGGCLTVARRTGILLTLMTVSLAAINDLLIVLDVWQTLRLTELATAAIVFSANHVMVHDYHRLIANMEGLILERTTELRAMTATARRAEESSRGLLDAATDAIILSCSGRVRFANAAAHGLLDHHESAPLIGRDPLELVHPDDRASARARLAEVQSAGRASAIHEERYVGAGGSVRVAEVIRVPLNFEGEESIVAIIRDITERQQLEDQLQFSDRMASLGTLAAGVAHEINNPMAYVLGNIEVLRDLIATGAVVASPEMVGEVAQLMDEAEDGARRVVHIVRDLKTFTRREVGDPLAPVVLEEVLDTAAEMASNQIRYRARLVRDYRGATTVLGNHVRLGQVFLNLVINAAQAIPEGEPGQHQIVLRTYHDRDGVAVAEVVDSGAGIDPDTRDRIFDPFFTTKPVGVGTGLGLSSALGILSALGATIEADGTVGGGTTMRVRFPRRATDEPTRQPVAAASTVTMPFPVV